MESLKTILARNIGNYRRQQGLTQEELARQLGISFQAISKWENEHVMPDISLLPALCRVLNISVDKLLGYNFANKPMTIYEEEYKTPDYYWGIVPNKMCYQVLQLYPPTKPFKLLDIGSGEGKDAVFFARNGYDVTAFDISDSGIEKTKRLTEKMQVHVHIFKADIADFRMDTSFDILFSSGVLHYIKPELRGEILDNYKRFTNKDGLHAFNVFVQKPFIAPPPEKEPHAYKWRSGELLTYYHDWLLQESAEVIFDCNSSGVPHKHAMTNMIAQKMS